MSLPWNNLNDYVHDWMKGLQEIIDSIAPDPDADNSMLPLASLPYKFDCTFYCTASTNDVIDGYNTWDKGYGYQPWLIGYRLNLTNNVLRVVNQSFMGKCAMSSPDRWGWLTNEDIATIEAAGREVYSRSIEVVNNYPTNTIKVVGGTFGAISFKPLLHEITDIQIKYPMKNDTWKTRGTSLVSATTAELPVYNDDTGFYDSPYYADYQSIGQQPNYSVYSDLIAVFDSITQAEYIVNTLSQYNTNNDVINYTKTGSEYKLYYGDHYLIYALDDSKIYNYQDLFTGTKQATDGINSWNPSAPPIKTPTYNEVKHEDDPEPIVDDDYTDMGLGVETDGMAMYNMAVVTRDELIQLITDFEANADTGLSFIPHVLGLYKLGFESSVLLTTKSEQIKLHKEPNGTSAFTSVENYNIVENQEVLIDCGSITVDREELLTNTFLDFSPYTTYEMFIPGCGWITLPDTIVGRTISVSIVFDLTTCSCKGVVRSEGTLLGGNGTTLATVNGIIGSSVPLSINETGLQRAAIMNGSTQAAMALGTAFMGVGIGNPYMGASGIAMAAGALASNHIAGNSTYTSTKGGATDYSVFGDGWKAVLKITRPVLEIPDNYGHSVGFVVNRYAQLSEFSGFTVCVNPHIHISATSDEKEEIKRLLEEGVILPEGE